MLIKLLKNDLKKNMRWFWIVIVATIGFAGMSRGFKELGTNIGFLKWEVFYLIHFFIPCL